ncbi:hypothetical protein L599_005800000010, partial [Luteimonas sp. J16]
MGAVRPLPESDHDSVGTSHFQNSHAFPERKRAQFLLLEPASSR